MANTDSPAGSGALLSVPSGTAAAPTFHLVVVHPFAKYRRGVQITEAAAIATVLAGENAHHCNRVAN